MSSRCIHGTHRCLCRYHPISVTCQKSFIQRLQAKTAWKANCIRIEGEVTESEVTEGEEGMSIGSFTVKTDVGEVSIVDPSLLLMMLGVEYGGFTEEVLQKYFAVPKVGEKVCVYAEYAGYSDVLQAPAVLLWRSRLY